MYLFFLQTHSFLLQDSLIALNSLLSSFEWTHCLKLKLFHSVDSSLSFLSGDCLHLELIFFLPFFSAFSRMQIFSLPLPISFFKKVCTDGLFFSGVHNWALLCVVHSSLDLYDAPAVVGRFVVQLQYFCCSPPASATWLFARAIFYKGSDWFMHSTEMTCEMKSIWPSCCLNVWAAE